MRKTPRLFRTAVLAIFGIAAPLAHAGETAATAAAPSPVKAEFTPDGVALFSVDGAVAAALRPFLFAKGWQLQYPDIDRAAKPAGNGTAETFARKLLLAPISVELHLDPPKDAKAPLGCRVRFTAAEDAFFESAGMVMDIRTPVAAGLAARLDDETVTLPEAPAKDKPQLALNNQARTLFIPGRTFGGVTLAAPKPVQIAINDARPWNDPNFPMQLHLGGDKRWKKGEVRELAFTVAFARPLDLEGAAPQSAMVEPPPAPAPAAPTPVPAPPKAEAGFVVRAGADWIPLAVTSHEIAEKSILDFTEAPWRHQPAGRFGRVVVNPATGHFAFADDPEKRPQRFYGVNFCYDAQFLEGNEPEILATRLAAMGYNAVRLHHFDATADWMKPRLVDAGRDNGTSMDLTALNQLDRFVSAMETHGMYITLDLLASRKIKAKAIWPDAAAPEALVDLRAAIPVNDKAFDNWAAFARTLLDRANPYTKVRYSDNPAIIGICLINEGNVANFLKAVVHDPALAKDWQRAWNQWLAVRLQTEPDALKNANYPGNPAEGTVPFEFGGDFYWVDNDQLATRLGLLREFLAEREAATFRKMRDVVRSFGCQALLTNQNGWIQDPLSPIQRADYDFVDDHFYVDLGEKFNGVPRQYSTLDPVGAGIFGGLSNAWLRQAGKPFTVSEYNAAIPNPNRGFTGLAAPALAALQDWDGLWRFAYSHSRANLFTPAPPRHALDIVTDPLSLYTERAALCLFLRRDLSPSPAALLVRGPDDQFRAVARSRGTFYIAAEQKDQKRLQPIEPLAQWVAAGARVAQLRESGDADRAARAFATAEPLTLSPQAVYAPDAEAKLLAELAKRGWSEAPATAGDPKNGKTVKTHGYTLNPISRTFAIDTDRTVGVFAPAETTTRLDGATWTVKNAPATAWASAMDGNAPLHSAKRILVAHLTEVLASGTAFADATRGTLTVEGEPPWLAQRGQVELTLVRNADAPVLKAWAVDHNGNRHEEIPVRADKGTLSLTLSTQGRDGANLLYELAEQ